MRIVFISAVDFGRHCLLEVLKRKGNVVGILNPGLDRAGLNSDYADLAGTAAENGVPLYRINKVGAPDTIELIRSLNPDVIFVFGFSQLIPKEVLAIPSLGSIGTHPALLPRNRGRHPLIWTLIEGLTESGLTFFYMDEGADSGDILWQKPFRISSEDDASTLYAKIIELASEAIGEFLPQLEEGVAPRRPQDHSQATYWRKRTEADGEINWLGDATTAYNLIRALTKPYPGAHTFLSSQRLRIWRSRTLEVSWPDSVVIPGEIFEVTSSSFLARCGDGALEILDWDWVGNGVELQVGARMGSNGL